MGSTTSTTTGYGYSLSEEELERLWELYETSETAIDWIVEERDEYNMLADMFQNNRHLVGVTSNHLGEYLGTLILARETMIRTHDFGVFNRPKANPGILLGSYVELTDLSRTLGIYRDPCWLTEVSYG